MNLLIIASKFVLRDLRAGELWLFILSLILATTCMSSIQFYSDRIEKAMKFQASSLIGGDRVIVSNRPIDKNIFEIANKYHLISSLTTSFYSVVLAKDKLILADVKAVASPYPLRGQLITATNQHERGGMEKAVPQSGEIWVQSRLMQELALKLSDSVKIGKAKFTVKKILIYEPERAGSWFSIAPRILMNLSDVPTTDIIQPGSRIEYRLLLKGDEKNLGHFDRIIKPILNPGQELIYADADSKSFLFIKNKMHDFLNISVIISVFLSGTALVLATQNYCSRHRKTVAMMRCFGASFYKTISLFVIGLLLLFGFSLMLGVSFGWLLQRLLESLFSGIINFPLPSPSIMSATPTVFIGLLLLIGFSLPQLIRLKEVSSQELLRTNNKKLPELSALVYGFALLSVTLILFWQTQNIKLLFLVILAISCGVSVMYLLANVLIYLLNQIQRQFISAWRIGLLNVVRHRSNSILQMTSFSLIFLAILLLIFIYNDLTRKWQNDLPKNTPNYFMINIAPSHLQNLNDFLKKNKIMTEPLYPVIRGRLTKLDDKPIKQSLTVDQQSDNSLSRDLYLTYRDNLVPGNQIIAGEWWSKKSQQAFVSVEAGFADRLGLKLGQKIGLNISGTEVNAKILNLRQVSWTSFKPNFFMIFTPNILDKFPQTYMTSFYLDEKRISLLKSLNNLFADITIIDIADIIIKLQAIISQLSIAMTYLLFFMLTIGMLVLIAGVMANIHERSHDTAILRAVGASSAELRKILLAEFLSLGALAGISSGITAQLGRWILSLWFVDFPIHLSVWPIYLTPLVSSIFIGVVGYVSSIRVLRSSPMTLLKTF